MTLLLQSLGTNQDSYCVFSVVCCQSVAVWVYWLCHLVHMIKMKMILYDVTKDIRILEVIAVQAFSAGIFTIVSELEKVLLVFCRNCIMLHWVDGFVTSPKIRRLWVWIPPRTKLSGASDFTKYYYCSVPIQLIIVVTCCQVQLWVLSHDVALNNPNSLFF